MCIMINQIRTLTNEPPLFKVSNPNDIPSELKHCCSIRCYTVAYIYQEKKLHL